MGLLVLPPERAPGVPLARVLPPGRHPRAEHAAPRPDPRVGRAAGAVAGHVDVDVAEGVGEPPVRLQGAPPGHAHRVAVGEDDQGGLQGDGLDHAGVLHRRSADPGKLLQSLLIVDLAKILLLFWYLLLLLLLLLQLLEQLLLLIVWLILLYFCCCYHCSRCCYYCSCSCCL